MTAYTKDQLTNPTTLLAIIRSLDSDDAQEALVEAFRGYGLHVPRCLL